MSLPDDVSTIEVTALYQDTQANAGSGTVTFAMTRNALGDESDDLLFIPVPVVATLDDTGAISVTLPCTDDDVFSVLDWRFSSWGYQVTEVITFGHNTWTRNYQISLPSSLGSSVDLSSLGEGVAAQ